LLVTLILLVAAGAVPATMRLLTTRPAPPPRPAGDVPTGPALGYRIPERLRNANGAPRPDQLERNRQARRCNTLLDRGHGYVL
jgi:hypothetical protein